MFEFLSRWFGKKAPAPAPKPTPEPATKPVSPPPKPEIKKTEKSFPDPEDKAAVVEFVRKERGEEMAKAFEKNYVPPSQRASLALPASTKLDKSYEICFQFIAKHMFNRTLLPNMSAELEQKLSALIDKAPEEFVQSTFLNGLYYQYFEGKFRWTEYEYWLNKLGEDEVHKHSLFLHYYLNGHEEDAWGLDPVTLEGLEEHVIPLHEAQECSRLAGITPPKQRRWSYFLDFFKALTPDQQAPILQIASKRLSEKFQAWQKEHPTQLPKRGDYWLYQSFLQALYGRTDQIRNAGLSGIPENIEYFDFEADDPRPQEWQKDQDCPWQIDHSQKNPLFNAISRPDKNSPQYKRLFGES